MDIDIITQYILAIVPAFTAVVGMIVTLGVGIGKIKKANSETTTKVTELSENDRALKRQLQDVHRENVELKKQLNEVTARMKHLYFVEKSEDKGE
jgi:predicted RNase H-like nuclease (RuvC/YqgF family)